MCILPNIKVNTTYFFPDTRVVSLPSSYTAVRYLGKIVCFGIISCILTTMSVSLIKSVHTPPLTPHPHPPVCLLLKKTAYLSD